MSKDLNSKLGIRPGSRVCLVRPGPGVLTQLRQDGSDISILIGRVEGGYDVILYWVDPFEAIGKGMLDLQKRIKPNGKIWVIIPRQEVAQNRVVAIDWQQMQEEILNKTHLVDNKVVSINDEEYGTQFVIRKEYRNQLP